MRHATFDLNLIRVLSVLFEERSVTRAGHRLGRTQSAISNSLRKLREITGDPLLVRGAEGMTLTPKARALEDPVQEIIRLADDMLSDDKVFRPEFAGGRCRLGAPDRLSLPLVLPFIATLAEQAPHLAVEVITTDRERALALLDENRLDVAIGWFDGPPTRIRAELLFQEGLVCLCREGHPLLDAPEPVGLAAILSFPHLMVSAAEDPRAIFDLLLARIGRQRDTQLSVSNFTMVPSILRHNDMVGVFTERVADALANDHGLAVLPVPMEIEPLDHFMVWHHRNDADPQQIWIREQLRILGQRT